MTSVTRRIAEWLNRPQRTRGDGLIVGLVGAALFFIGIYLTGRLLDLIGILNWRNQISVWLAALIAGLALSAGLFLGRRALVSSPQTYELYAEHLRDALADLRRLSDGELANFSLRDYAENGLFEPAYRLLTTRGRERGDVRFSVLHPSPDDPDTFVMSHGGQLAPALGHSMEGRQEFRLAIDDSFAGLAYRTRRVQMSNDLPNDERWHPHIRARPGREYESMVSVPLVSGGAVDAVLNVLATKRNAFDRVDQTYITLLGSVIDVARSAAGN
jgi:hypothetical protein